MLLKMLKTCTIIVILTIFVRNDQLVKASPEETNPDTRCTIADCVSEFAKCLLLKDKDSKIGTDDDYISKYIKKNANTLTVGDIYQFCGVCNNVFDTNKRSQCGQMLYAFEIKEYSMPHVNMICNLRDMQQKCRSAEGEIKVSNKVFKELLNYESLRIYACFNDLENDDSPLINMYRYIYETSAKSQTHAVCNCKVINNLIESIKINLNVHKEKLSTKLRNMSVPDLEMDIVTATCIANSLPLPGGGNMIYRILSLTQAADITQFIIMFYGYFQWTIKQMVDAVVQSHHSFHHRELDVYQSVLFALRNNHSGRSGLDDHYLLSNMRMLPKLPINESESYRILNAFFEHGYNLADVINICSQNINFCLKYELTVRLRRHIILRLSFANLDFHTCINGETNENDLVVTSCLQLSKLQGTSQANACRCDKVLAIRKEVNEKFDNDSIGDQVFDKLLKKICLSKNPIKKLSDWPIENVRNVLQFQIPESVTDTWTPPQIVESLLVCGIHNSNDVIEIFKLILHFNAYNDENGPKLLENVTEVAKICINVQNSPEDCSCMVERFLLSDYSVSEIIEKCSQHRGICKNFRGYAELSKNTLMELQLYKPDELAICFQNITDENSFIVQVSLRLNMLRIENKLYNMCDCVEVGRISSLFRILYELRSETYLEVTKDSAPKEFNTFLTSVCLKNNFEGYTFWSEELDVIENNIELLKQFNEPLSFLYELFVNSDIIFKRLWYNTHWYTYNVIQAMHLLNLSPKDYKNVFNLFDKILATDKSSKDLTPRMFSAIVESTKLTRSVKHFSDNQTSLFEDVEKKVIQDCL